MVETEDQTTFIYKWLKECEKENIILCFKGDFNQDLVNAILILTEREKDVQNSHTLVRSRVFSVMVECMQNIRKYGTESAASSDLKPGIVLVCINEGNYVIKTGNFIKAADEAALKKRLDDIKAIKKEDLKDLHKKVLRETKLSEKSGAGLGLISMARKCDSLDYSFRKVSEDLSFYALDLSINKQQE